MKIFTVINSRYQKLGLGWGNLVRTVTGIGPTFVCSDITAYDFLRGYEFDCELRSPTQRFSTSKREAFGNSSFPDDDAAYTVSLKFRMALEYLAAGQDVLYSDVDAAWLRNPLPDLQRYDADVIFQPGSFPDDVKADWGFTVCTGFFCLRSCEEAMRLCQKINDHFDGSDQRTFNRILKSEYDIAWETRPSSWEHCLTQNGWVLAIRGASAATGMTFVALPHAYYQRHGTTPGTCEHAVICHPNSPKNQEQKFEVLRALGIDLGVAI